MQSEISELHVLARTFTIREGLGSFFLVVINTLDDEIYLHLVSECNDKEEQQFFDK
jgi:hypothetical protein